MAIASLDVEFTGKERDSETGLDYFGARYFSGAQGRFTSPDRPFDDQYPDNPQSWNPYSYVRNTPLSAIDPSGRKCVTVTSDGKSSQADDGTGGGCDAADVDKEGNAKPHDIYVNAPLPSFWEIVFAARVPIYVKNDVPLNAAAQNVAQQLSARINAYPAVCGGGWYNYAGRELEAGPVSGFAGAIKEHDSRAGDSSGALFEGGGGGAYLNVSSVGNCHQ